MPSSSTSELHVAFPATRQREISLRDLLGHHPQSEDVAAIWTKAKAAKFLGNYGRVQAGAEKIIEVFGWKSCGLDRIATARGAKFSRASSRTRSISSCCSLSRDELRISLVV